MENESLMVIQVKKVPIDEGKKMECPSCGSKALYRYGRARYKQRFYCLLCGRQFIAGYERHFPQTRPICQKCGAKMYIHQNEGRFVRYRCSRYPACKNHVKVMRENTVINRGG